jgi:glyoxylase-like metal-dependent hydrolase (beta-lactamase superfamily II)
MPEADIDPFETDAGLVLVDTGVEQTSARMAETLREATDAPVHTAIYTHGHLDHAYGLEHYLTEGQDDPRVIAHENVPDRFARYARTAGHNEAINARQFGGAASETDDHTYVYCPDREVLCSGDFHITSHPTPATHRRSSATPGSGRTRSGRWRGWSPSISVPATAGRSSVTRRRFRNACCSRPRTSTR